MDQIIYIHSTPAHKDPFLVGYTETVSFVQVIEQSALEKALQQNQFCCALVYLSLQDIDSLALLERLRQLDTELPGIIVGKTDQPQDVLAASKLNIQGILMLPLNENDFHERVNPYMREPLSRRELAIKPDAENKPNLGQSRPIVDLFYEAQSKELNRKFQEALELYQTIIGRKRLANEEERSLREKAFFEVARCYHNLSQNNSAVRQYQSFVKAFEHSLLVNDAWYNLGEIYYKANQLHNARICYKKASLIPNPTKKGIINKAKQMLKKLDKSS